MEQDEEHHHKGALRLRLSMLARLLGFRWYDMVYVERSLERPIPDFAAAIPLDIAPSTAADRDEILARRPARQGPRLRYRFADPRVTCYVARSRGDLVGYSCIRRRVMDITGLDAIELPFRDMPPDTGLTHDAYVWPEHRRQGIFHALLAEIHRRESAAGLVRICNLIDPENTASLKVHLDLGARIQRFRLLKLPGMKLSVVGPDFVIGGVDSPVQEQRG